MVLPIIPLIGAGIALLAADRFNKNVAKKVDRSIGRLNHLQERAQDMADSADSMCRQLNELQAEWQEKFIDEYQLAHASASRFIGDEPMRSFREPSQISHNPELPENLEILKAIQNIGRDNKALSSNSYNLARFNHLDKGQHPSLVALASLAMLAMSLKSLSSIEVAETEADKVSAELREYSEQLASTKDMVEVAIPEQLKMKLSFLSAQRQSIDTIAASSSLDISTKTAQILSALKIMEECVSEPTFAF